ncbi:Homeobox protein EgHBX3 [Taenia solium]|eukprot:TsM_001091900 transcript=TsM_001091900 gene=TsM_001091900
MLRSNRTSVSSIFSVRRILGLDDGDGETGFDAPAPSSTGFYNTQQTLNEGKAVEGTAHGFNPTTGSPLLPTTNSSMLSRKTQKELNYRMQSSPSQATGQQNQAKPNHKSTSPLSGLLFPFPLSSTPNDCGLSSSPFKPCNPRQFRRRIMFDKFQVSQLENRFQEQRYLTVRECVALAHTIGLTPAQVN